MVITPTEEINKIVSLGAGPTSDRAVIKHEILSFEQSRPYKIMQKGVDYYEGRHDILHVQRTMIGPDGSLEAVDNIPNEHIVDNIYADMVDKKVNYLLGKPIAVSSDDETYTATLEKSSAHVSTVRCQ